MEVPASIRPPRDAYSYWPSREYVMKGSGTHSQRFIFYKQTFTPFEAEKLSRLKAALAEQRISLPPQFDDCMLLRLCYGTHWKTRNAVAAVQTHLEWRRTYMPNNYSMMFEQVRGLLAGGCLYVHGRDCRFRPCIIMNYPKFNFRQHTIFDYMPLIGFFLDYVIDNMFLPGQVENWVTITDMGHMGLSDLPVNHLRKLIEILQQNYRCRLAHNYVLNAPTSVTIVWAIIKKFIDRDTVERISITGKNTDPNLLQLFNPRQVEERYGGTAPNLTEFWPPCVPDGPFEAPGQVPGALLSRHSSYPIDAQREVSALSEPAKSIIEEVHESIDLIDVYVPEPVAAAPKEEEVLMQPRAEPPSTKDSLVDHPPPEPEDDKGKYVSSAGLPMEIEVPTEESKPRNTEPRPIEIDAPVQSSFSCFCRNSDRSNSSSCELF